MQGLSFLYPNLDWAALCKQIRRRPAVRQRPRPAPVDSMRHWPAEWRVRWAAAFTGSEEWLSEHAHPAQQWSPAFKTRIASHLTRYRNWLSKHDPAGHPLRAYAESMTGYASTSMTTWLESLVYGLAIVEPDRDLSSLREAARAAKRRARARDKGARMATLEDLRTLGRQLRAEADSMPFGAHAATRYRDGLAISLLAARPVRIRNFASLRLGKSLIEADGVFQMFFADTKNGDPWSAPIPVDVQPGLERWLQAYRPLLIGNKDDGSVWLGMDGEALRASHLSGRTRQWAQKRLGKAVSAHLARSAFMTDLCAIDPENITIGQVMLGHRDKSTSARFYEQGKSRHAAAHLDTALDAFRMPPAAKTRKPKVR
ncbi:hypothetical protein [Caenispirillum salinarum]|uniref:hypothetical protein n=1 Tax=Caenispirillum salinarum TaxID=859058 RepID=UPI00384B9B74